MSDYDGRGRLADMLLHAYRYTHPDDDLLGVANDQDAIILQHLRLRTMPATFVAENFESFFQSSRSVDQAPTNRYRQTWRRFQSLSTAELRRLQARLLKAEGYVFRRSGWVVDPEGFGDMEAFAFDPTTGRSVARRGIGSHFLTIQELYRLIRPHELGERWPLDRLEHHDDLVLRMTNVVAGFIVHLPGWPVPFLHLWEKELGVTTKQRQKNVRCLQAQKKFLILEANGRRP